MLSGVEIERGVAGDIAQTLEEALDPCRSPIELGQQRGPAGLDGGEQRDGIAAAARQCIDASFRHPAQCFPGDQTAARLQIEHQGVTG